MRNPALIGRGGQHPVNLQRVRDLTFTRLSGLPREGALRFAPRLQNLVRHIRPQDAVVHVDLDLVAGFQQSDSSTGGSLWRNVANRNSRSTARETPVGNECAAFAQTQAFQVRVGYSISCMPGPPFGPSY